MAAVTFQFLADVVASFEPGDGEGAVGRSRVSADHGAAAAADLAPQVFQLKAAAGDSGPGHAVLLVDHQRRQGGVGNGDGLIFAALDIDLCNRIVGSLEAGGRLGLLDFQPAVLDGLQDDLPRLVRPEGSQIPQFPGVCFVAGPGDMKFGGFNGVMGDSVLLLDGDRRFFVVFKIYCSVPIGIEGDKLAGSVRQVR